MNPVEVECALRSFTILVDTREQDTPQLRKRLGDMSCPWERRKLDFGDYSACCQTLDLSAAVCVERKMSLDELCACYCKGRGRFEREFERAREAGAKLYLLIEGATWEKAYNGRYRSRMSPQALVASMQAWLTRYNCQLLFCEAETSGKLIRDILYREMKERLEALPDEHGE